VTQDAKLSLTDRTGFWLALSGVLAVLGGISITIAITEYHRPWTSAWFIVGMATCGLGCVSALWALMLYLAHEMADRRYQADRQKFMADNFSVQQEALIKIKDLISNISEELLNFRNGQQAAAASGQLETFIEIIGKIKNEDRFVSEEDFREFFKYGGEEMEPIKAWLEKLSVCTDKIYIPVNELSASALLGGSQRVTDAVNAYLKVVGKYMFSLPRDYMKSIKDERVAREQVLSAVGKALKEGPFDQ
jgi:hypothetical protein